MLNVKSMSSGLGLEATDFFFRDFEEDASEEVRVDSEDEISEEMGAGFLDDTFLRWASFVFRSDRKAMSRWPLGHENALYTRPKEISDVTFRQDWQ